VRFGETHAGDRLAERAAVRVVVGCSLHVARDAEAELVAHAGSIAAQRGAGRALALEVADAVRAVLERVIDPRAQRLAEQHELAPQIARDAGAALVQRREVAARGRVTDVALLQIERGRLQRVDRRRVADLIIDRTRVTTQLMASTSVTLKDLVLTAKGPSARRVRWDVRSLR